MSLSEMQVDVVEKGTPFLHFVTNVCAIVGGLWAMSSLVDSTVYHGQKLIKKKIDIGKYG
jgi:endoplasmic reticulum-Golgi intermediate compartment protein 3